MGLNFWFWLSQYNHICHLTVWIWQHAVWVYLNKHKPHNRNDQVNEIIGQTHTPETNKLKPENKDPHDPKSPGSNIDSSSDSK